MKLLKMAGVGTIALVTMSASAYAQDSGDVRFGAEINNSCAVEIIDGEGEFGVSNDQVVMDSTLVGGSATTAEVTTNNFVNSVVIETPQTFSSASSPDANDGIVATTEYDIAADGLLGALLGGGVTNRPGTTPTLLRPGTADLTIDARVEKNNGENFSSGTYEYTATVKCIAS